MKDLTPIAIEILAMNLHAQDAARFIRVMRWESLSLEERNFWRNKAHNLLGELEITEE